jgi:hypothetical protein
MVFDCVTAALQGLKVVVGALFLPLSTIQEACGGVNHGDVPVVLGVELHGDSLYII